MVWGLGAYAKGRADREKENRSIRAENAALYNEYVRLNPDMTADQADAYANQLSGGSEYFRGMLPSKNALQERVNRRQTELANAARSREIQNRNAQLNELEKAGNIFADIAVGSRDMETARKAFGDMGTGVFSENIIGKDGTVNQAVVGLGTRLAKTQITPEVQQYISQWGSTANPAQMDSVINRITNKDLRGPFQQQLLNMADNKKTMLITKIPNSAKLAADSASVTDMNAQDVNWDKISSEIAPWVTDPTELQQLREKHYDPIWSSWQNRREDAINADKTTAATAASTLISNLNAEELRSFKTVKELENFILNEVRKSVDPNLLTLNALLDIDRNLEKEISAKFNEIKKTTLNQVNEQEKVAVASAVSEQRQKTTSDLALKDPKKFRENLQAIVGPAFFGEEFGDEKNSAKAFQMAVQIQAETEQIAQAMMLDISAPNYYNMLVQTMKELSDFQITESGIDPTSIRLAMMNMATKGQDPSEAVRIINATAIIANAGSSENYTGGGLPEIVADDTLFQQFMIEYERLTEEAINNKFDIVPNDVSQLTPNVVENNLRGQASEIRQMLGGQGGLNDTIRDLRKAIAEKKFVGSEQILEDARDDRIIIRDEIASIDRTIKNYNQMLASPDLTNFTSEEQIVIKDVLSDLTQLRSDLLKTEELIVSEQNNFRAMKFDAVTTKDPADKTANSADFFVAKIGELKTSGKTTTELSVEAEQLVDEMISTFNLNTLFVDPNDRARLDQFPALSWLTGVLKDAPVSGDIDQIFGSGKAERQMRNMLVQKAREELGLQPMDFGVVYNSVDVDQYTGWTILNLIEEIGDVAGAGLRVVGKQLYNPTPEQ